MTHIAAPLARNADPITSHMAADRAAAFKQSHADRILSALRQQGPSTAHELEAATGLNYVQIDRRMIEIERQGRARRTKDTRRTPTGGRAFVWEAV